MTETASFKLSLDFHNSCRAAGVGEPACARYEDGIGTPTACEMMAWAPDRSIVWKFEEKYFAGFLHSSPLEVQVVAAGVTTAPDALCVLLTWMVENYTEEFKK